MALRMATYESAGIYEGVNGGDGKFRVSSSSPGCCRSAKRSLPVETERQVV